MSLCISLVSFSLLASISWLYAESLLLAFSNLIALRRILFAAFRLLSRRGLVFLSLWMERHMLTRYLISGVIGIFDLLDGFGNGIDFLDADRRHEVISDKVLSMDEGELLVSGRDAILVDMYSL